MKAGPWIAGPLPCRPRAVRRNDVRYLSGALALSVLMAGGCASLSTGRPAASGATLATFGATSGSTSGAAPHTRAPGAAIAAQGGRSAGAQAAARMTPEQLDGAMKTISVTNAALGMKLMSNDLPGAAKDAQTLATAFADVERFWAQANKADAVKLAQQARIAASESAAAATAGDAARAAASRSNMTGTCKQCHGVYREGDAQAGYRIKAGVL